MNLNLPLELDFTTEKINSTKLMSLFENTPHELTVPKIYAVTPRVLIMELIEGARVDDLEYLKAHHIDPRKVSKVLWNIFAEMIFIHGFVHWYIQTS